MLGRWNQIQHLHQPLESLRFGGEYDRWKDTIYCWQYRVLGPHRKGLCWGVGIQEMGARQKAKELCQNGPEAWDCWGRFCLGTEVFFFCFFLIQSHSKHSGMFWGCFSQLYCTRWLSRCIARVSPHRRLAKVSSVPGGIHTPYDPIFNPPHRTWGQGLCPRGAGSDNSLCVSLPHWAFSDVLFLTLVMEIGKCDISGLLFPRPVKTSYQRTAACTPIWESSVLPLARGNHFICLYIGFHERNFISTVWDTSCAPL